MKKKTRNLLLQICIVAVMLILIHFEQAFFVFFCLYTYSLYKLYPERYKLIKIIKSAFVIKFYNVVIWFISYILAIKILNLTYSVDEDYLKFSPAIVAIPVSILVIYLLLVLVSAISSLIWMLTNHSNDQSIFHQNFRILQYLTIVTIIPVYFAALSSDYIARIAILSDASFISDCGVKQWGVMYLRKNNNECYKFTLDRTLFSEPLTTIPSKK